MFVDVWHNRMSGQRTGRTGTCQHTNLKILTMGVTDCHSFHDFRRLAMRRLPSPIFNYIDGGGRR